MQSLIDPMITVLLCQKINWICLALLIPESLTKYESMTKVLVDLDNTFKENTKYNDYADVRKVKFLLQMSNYYIQ